MISTEPNRFYYKIVVNNIYEAARGCLDGPASALTCTRLTA